MLELLSNPERIKREIISQTGISEQELIEKVVKRQEEFHGLINEAAALYSIAKEMGVRIGEERKELEFTPIGKLAPGMQNVNIHARVMRVFAPRRFEKEGRRGRVCNLLIADETGETTLVLWHRDVELVERGVVEKGDAVDVLGAYVKDGGVHLSLGGQLLKVKERGKLPEVRSELRKIAELEEGATGVDFVGEVIDVGAVNSFEKNGKVKQVSSLFVADETGMIRVALWDGNASVGERARRGDRVKVENAYVKGGLFGKEAHVDWKGRVILNPNIELPPIKIEKIKRMKVGELREGEEAEVEGEVVRVEGRSFGFCRKCRVTAQGACPKCGSSELEARLLVNAVLKDESGEMNCVMFGEVAKQFLEVKEIPQDVDARTIVELKRDGLVGRKVVAIGKAKRNKFTGELEFAVRRVVI